MGGGVAMKAVGWFLVAASLCLFPANVYFGVTGHPLNAAFAVVNLLSAAIGYFGIVKTA